jgi:hypothetical protein
MFGLSYNENKTMKNILENIKKHLEPTPEDLNNLKAEVKEYMKAWVDVHKRLFHIKESNRK